MGGHKSISGTSYEQIPPPPTPDYIVTGTLNPDATGNYFYAGTYNGKPYYRKADGSFCIWYHTVPVPSYQITLSPGYLVAGWIKLGPIITGNYTPGGGCTGTATVTAGS